MKTFLHERTHKNGCVFEWTETDTQAPNVVRHECDLANWHDMFDFAKVAHMCTCGLMHYADGAA